jgi:predicted DNA binding protein
MRYLELTIEPPIALVPDVFELVADSPHIAEARLQEWNPEGDSTVTLFYVCDGDRESVVDRLRRSPLVLTADATSLDVDRFGLLVRVDPGSHPLVDQVFRTVTGAGLIVLKPVVYRDARVHVRLVGDDETLRRAVDRVPDPIGIRVETLGALEDHPAAGVWGLTERQRAALREAIDLGYYEQPRRATHEDVAAALGVSASTASEHLQKAEAHLVRGAMVEGG